MTSWEVALVKEVYTLKKMEKEILLFGKAAQRFSANICYVTSMIQTDRKKTHLENTMKAVKQVALNLKL